jgi:tRNA A37 methylthiotransferase MiaB
MTAKNEEKIGRVFPVMVEERTEPSKYKGRTDDHTLVHFAAEKELAPGDIVSVCINAAKTFYISGTMVIM